MAMLRRSTSFGMGMDRAVKVKWRISGKGMKLKDPKGEATDSATEQLKEELKVNLKFFRLRLLMP